MLTEPRRAWGDNVLFRIAVFWLVSCIFRPSSALQGDGFDRALSGVRRPSQQDGRASLRTPRGRQAVWPRTGSEAPAAGTLGLAPGLPSVLTSGCRQRPAEPSRLQGRRQAACGSPGPQEPRGQSFALARWPRGFPCQASGLAPERGRGMPGRVCPHPGSCCRNPLSQGREDLLSHEEWCAEWSSVTTTVEARPCCRMPASGAPTRRSECGRPIAQAGRLPGARSPELRRGRGEAP